jgi:nucleoside-diphosphate-sugar epimerase
MLDHLNATPKAPKRVVVIGANGFVGGAVVARLAKDAVPTLALSRSEVDLLKAGAADKLAGLLRSDDSVVAVSALAPVKNTRMLADNMTIVLAMVEALAKAPVAHVVNISSDAIYADGPLPLIESSPAAPTSLHGAMHVARELALRAEVKSPQAHLRPTLIYGASDPHNGYGPNRFRRLAAEGKDIVLFGEGEERRDHVYIGDVAEIVVQALQWKSSGALNIATGEVHSFRDLAERAVAISGKRSAIKGSPRSGPMPHGGYRPFDIAAAHKAFPDFAYTSIADGMRKSAAAA